MKYYPKIDIYVNGVYWRSTNAFKRCKNAKASFVSHNPVQENKVKCYFAKKR